MALRSSSPQQTERAKDQYSPVYAFVYIFNLIIGVGALSLPKSFSEAGYVLGTILLVVLAFMSYVTATFMIEAMASANAYMRHKTRTRQPLVRAQSSVIQNEDKKNATDYAYEKTGNGVHSQYESIIASSSRRSPRSKSPNGINSDEKTPLVEPIISEDSDSSDEEDKRATSSSGVYSIPTDDYEIDKKFEMGEMANLFYHPIGILLYYVAVCLYLYGDLAIYAVAIPKSLVVVACTKPPSPNSTELANDTGQFNTSAPCFGGRLNEQEAYYVFLSITCLFLCPWTFFDLTKSKYVQLFTTVLRNVAFILMIIIAIVQLAEGKRSKPAVANFSGFPSLFGVSIYSFMCQHSLPGMVTPMRTKKGISALVFIDFSLILVFYLFLTYTGVFSFPILNDLYTLNFFKQFSRHFSVGQQVLAILGYYLALFPVFTLSTNFPIISITLRENLKSLAVLLLRSCRKTEAPFHRVVDTLVFPVLALLPAVALAFATTNVQYLVSITGAFPGIAVQYVIPVTLAFAAKYIISKKLKVTYRNKHKSPFSYIFFLVLVLAWTVVSVALVIVEYALKIVNARKHHHDDGNSTLLLYY